MFSIINGVPTWDIFKAGDDVQLAGLALLPPNSDWVTNQPTGWLVDPSGNKVDLAVTCAVLDPPVTGYSHAITVSILAAATVALKPQLYLTDIRFRDAGTPSIIFHSPTYGIDLQPAETGVPA